MKQQAYRPSLLRKNNSVSPDKEARRSKGKVCDELSMTIEELEAGEPPITSRMEADSALRKMGVNASNKPGGDIMLLSAQHGLIQVLKFVEGPQFNLDYQNKFGDGLLHYAAKGNQTKMLSYLLQRGANPQLMNKFNETPAFFAAEMGSLKVLQFLARDKRTALDHQDKFGDTVLHFAARDGQLEIVEYLVKKNKRLTRIKNQEGKTALSYALDNQHSDVVQILKQNDASASTQDRQTCLQELARKLINEPADYKKSLFKHQPSKIQLFGRKITLDMIKQENAKALYEQELREMKKEKEKMRQMEKDRSEAASRNLSEERKTTDN